MLEMSQGLAEKDLLQVYVEDMEFVRSSTSSSAVLNLERGAESGDQGLL